MAIPESDAPQTETELDAALSRALHQIALVCQARGQNMVVMMIARLGDPIQIRSNVTPEIRNAIIRDMAAAEAATVERGRELVMATGERHVLPRKDPDGKN